MNRLLTYRADGGSGVTDNPTSGGGGVRTVNGIAPSSMGNVNLLSVDRDFVNADLVEGKITFIHNRGTKFVTVQIWNDLGEPIVPDKISPASLNATTVTLTSFQPLQNSWHVIIS
jgi:hypothetical protein